MKKPFAVQLLTALLALHTGAGLAADSSQAKSLFKTPPREYSTGPLWVWNDMLTDEQLIATLRDMAAQNVKQVWVHPRPGLMTPYLGSDWFRLWKLALKEAERLDMNVWIYDENSYPSGFAGGLVPEAMPESRGKGLAFREAKTAPQWAEEMVAVYRMDGVAAQCVTAEVKSGAALPEGKYLVAREVRAGNSPWNGNRCYVNLLSPGVTEKFLELTLEPYRREIGKHFGQRVPGVFTDEPNILPAGQFPWSEVLAAEFQKRWGYDLLQHLPSLVQPVGDWQKVRHNFFSLLNSQFIERWARPYRDYCATNRLEWTGHYWDHEWPNCSRVPDNMAMYAWHQRPSIDCLMNQYAENTHSQFGNVRMVRELSSVANQLGINRTLCEIYGAGGWDLRFEDMKRIGDWLEVLGVNTLNQHLSYVTLRGARKRDHPQSFSYHEPWWNAYHLSADYFARLSAALCQGEQVNRVLILEPTTTAWMFQGQGGKLNELGDGFFKLLVALEAAQVEYDLADEDIMARHAKMDAGKLRVGARIYDAIVIPAQTENLDGTTWALLDKAASGKTAVLAAAVPSRKDGASLGAEAAHAWAARLPVVRTEDLPEKLASLNQQDGFRIQRQANDRGLLFHNRRQLADGEILFLVNTSLDASSEGLIESKHKGVEAWDLYHGTVAPALFERTPQGVRTAYKLPPSGSLMLFLSNKALAPAQPVQENVTLLKPLSEPEIQRTQPNVLTLDYVDVSAGGEIRTNLYFYKANQFVWQKNGMDRNPWDSAVQFKDELITKKFPSQSGFKVSYRFDLKGTVPKDLAIVLERPDLYTLACNGRELRAKKGEWWLDKAFARIPIAAVSREGENTVTLTAAPFTMYHEIEPAYLLGDFSLQSTATGFVVVAPEPLRLGSCNGKITHSNHPDGTMWLSGGIGFQPGVEDRTPFVVFDLCRPVDLAQINIWNYNEGHIRDLSSRGVRKARLTAARPGAKKNSPAEFNLDLGTFDLAQANGAQAAVQTLKVNAQGVRYVRLDVLSNHNGVGFPAQGTPDDQGFVGLAEVQFLIDSAAPLTGVKIHSVSGELKPFGRLAACLTDGSGLSPAREGWNAQGLPFYASGVAYRETFEAKNPSAKHLVSLPNWYGSVAEVRVNGKFAGYIDAPPWECDITRRLKRGKNQVEITVLGTLKNTLGPHHGNPALGAAWPSGFHTAPEFGPPPGSRYSTVAYGMFEPFVLKQIVRE